MWNNIHKVGSHLDEDTPSCKHTLSGFLFLFFSSHLMNREEGVYVRVCLGSVDLKCNVLSPEDNCVHVCVRWWVA